MKRTMLFLITMSVSISATIGYAHPKDCQSGHAPTAKQCQDLADKDEGLRLLAMEIIKTSAIVYHDMTTEFCATSVNNAWVCGRDLIQPNQILVTSKTTSMAECQRQHEAFCISSPIKQAVQIDKIEPIAKAAGLYRVSYTLSRTNPMRSGTFEMQVFVNQGPADEKFRRHMGCAWSFSGMSEPYLRSDCANPGI